MRGRYIVDYSSDVNFLPFTSINCVDIMYSAFPAYLYLNSAFGRYLLEPLFNYQDRPAFPLPYAAQDIGMLM